VNSAIKDAIPGFLTFITIVLWMFDVSELIDIGWWLILLPIWGPIAVGVLLFIIQEKLIK